MGAHLGTVQIQRHAKSSSLSSSFHSVSLCARVCASHPLSLSLVVNGDVKYLNTLCCLGTMHSNRWTGPVRVRCMQISIQSSPGCFQSNTSASGPVLIPLYPQPAWFFIKSNAVSAMSTWTSGPTAKAEQQTGERERIRTLVEESWNIWKRVWDIGELREISTGLCGIVFELWNKSSQALQLHSSTSMEIWAPKAYDCLGGKHVAETISLLFFHCYSLVLSLPILPLSFLASYFHFIKENEWCWGPWWLTDWFLMWQMKRRTAGHLETPGISYVCARRHAWTLVISLLAQLKQCTSHFHVTTRANWWSDKLADELNWGSSVKGTVCLVGAVWGFFQISMQAFC